MAQDIKMYNYFKQKFERKIEEFGKERMKGEIEKLHAENEKIKVFFKISIEIDYCLRCNNFDSFCSCQTVEITCYSRTSLQAA